MGQSPSSCRGAGASSCFLNHALCVLAEWMGEERGTEPVPSPVNVRPGEVVVVPWLFRDPTGFYADVWAALDTSTKPPVSQARHLGPESAFESRALWLG